MINIPTKVKEAISLSDLGSCQGNTASQVNNGMSQNFGNQNMNMQNQGYSNQNMNMQNQGYSNQNMNMQNQGYSNQNMSMQNGGYSNPNMNMQNQGYSNPNMNMQNQGYSNPNMNMQSQGFSSTVNNSAGMSGKSNGNGVILAKGQKISLSKFNPNLDEVDVGLGWDVSTNAYDLDSEAFLLGPGERVIGDEWFVFYNQPCSPDGSVRHSGDNRTGAGEGDDEVISLKLSQVNPQVEKIVFVVTINEAKQRNLNFAGVSNAYIRVVDKKQNKELVRFNLTEYYKEVTSMMVGELYKKNNEWRFNPIGNGTNDDLMGLCIRYGVNVAG